VRVPLSWIQDFAPVEGEVQALADVLDDLGLVVEGVVRVGEGLGDVVVARVEEIAPIPGAERIRRVVVDAGSGPLEVVCGAWNFAEGDLVPLAPVGAVLPGGVEIARRTMKGVVSNGMLCSPKELELADDHEGILVLGADGSAGGAGAGEAPAPGTPLLEALGIERDVVFDLAVEGNRPDAASVAGVARDLAARLGVPFSLPEWPEPAAAAPAVGELASVEVVDRDLCPRFVARVLCDVVVGPSPPWVARRLTLAGMRPLNNVVDASNYVMLELGQPTHPYDLDRLAGAGLRVRAARAGERLVTLDGRERRMGERSVGGGDDGRDCVICDAEDSPVAVAGVMGGASTEIGAGTRRVLLEAAYFAPMAVARTSKRLGLRTEASSRFERGCDPWGIDRAVRRFVDVLGASGPVTVAAGVIDERGEVPGPRQVQLRLGRLNAVLGTELDVATVSALLEPIGFSSRPGPPGVLEVTVPSFRPDTEREIDVVEEVARHHGYSRIPRRRPQAPQVGALSPYQRRRRFVREVMCGLGALEAWTPSLLAPGDHERAGWPAGLALANPLTEDQSVLRRTLLPGMLGALSSNAARRQGEVRLFEIGHVFPPPPPWRVEAALAERDLPVVDEREVLGLALAGPGDDALAASAAWAVLEDALRIVGVRLEQPAGAEPGPAGATLGLHPTRRATLLWAGGELGVVGEVDPEVLEAFGLDPGRQRVGWLEVDLVRLLEEVPQRPERAQAGSRFPSSDVDLAFVVPEHVPAAAVGATLGSAAGPAAEWVRLFDVYRGPGTAPGTRSLAFRLRLRAFDHTLGEEELQGIRQRCIEEVGAVHGAVLRA
jgi:phenylalanyl-tRNA synthetase beta chain